MSGERKPRPGTNSFVDAWGAARTTSPQGVVPGLGPYRTKSTGRIFRVANGKRIGNQGEVDLKEATTNNINITVKTQIADVTRPSASTTGMVDAGNVVVLHKFGVIIQQLSRDQPSQLLRQAKGISGPEVPIVWKANVSV